MKTPILLTIGLVSIASTSFSEEVLKTENFEQATGVSYYYPPPEGGQYQKFSTFLTAWANNDGQISVTPTDKAGVGDSGGLVVKVARATAAKGYLALSCEKITIPASADQIESALKKLQVDFSLKAPTGKVVNLYLLVDEKMLPADPALHESLKAKSYPSRITFPKATGSDEYTDFSLKVADLDPKDMEMMLQHIKDSYAGGSTEMQLVFTWTVFGDQWGEGQQFSVDNLKVSLHD